MRRSYLTLIILAIFVSCNNKSQDHDNFNYNKLETIGKVWGYLKYYHPGVAKGEINWDEILLKSLDRLDTIYSKEQLNKLIEELILCCDNKVSKYDTSFIKGDILKCISNKWINDTTWISKRNSKLLTNLFKNKEPFYNHYVSQDINVGNLYYNEKPYADSIFPSKNMRLLCLFRYWNIINYFYPYHEINDYSWGMVLKEYIPKFLNIEDTLDYHLKVLELTSELNDGHIWTESFPINFHFGIYSLPYKAVYVENTPVISEYFPDSLGKLYDVQIGDEIIEINNLPVKEIINKRQKYYSFSNTNQFYRRITEELLITPTLDSVKILLSRGESALEVFIKPYPLYDLYDLYENDLQDLIPCRIINDTIGYIDLEHLKINDVDKVMHKYLRLPKLIIDLRNYPKGVLYKISEYLNPKPTIFAKIFVPYVNMPGQFVWSKSLITGKNNPDYYKGKVVLLVNERTQSHAEFTAMCLQSAPNVITIGSTTAGTDGNISFVNLPGDIVTYFTSIGIVYPDSIYTQRVGIKIDTIIFPQIKDIKNQYDRLIESAINL
jgi:C-terminal processing protease CtpA/Prc